MLTAPLVATLTRREVDAIAAHELSHLRRKNYSVWIAFAIAAVLFSTSAFETSIPVTGILVVPELILPLVYLVALRGARKREFAADAGSISSLGDPLETSPS